MAQTSWERSVVWNFSTGKGSYDSNVNGSVGFLEGCEALVAVSLVCFKINHDSVGHGRGKCGKER